MLGVDLAISGCVGGERTEFEAGQICASGFRRGVESGSSMKPATEAQPLNPDELSTAAFGLVLTARALPAANLPHLRRQKSAHARTRPQNISSLIERSEAERI